MSLQTKKDLFKLIEIVIVTILLYIGYSKQQISSDWALLIVFVYVFLNLIRIMTEPLWKTKKSVILEVQKLKMYLLKRFK